MTDGSRYETTWHKGVRDGPFQVFRADGSLWGEGDYEKGRLAAPAWNYPKATARFDELALRP